MGQGHDPMVGRTISHYEIVEKLGGGGMGEVYRAEDTRLRRAVALKFLPAALTRDPEARSRFVNEAQAASSLDHPHICTIHEIDETDDGRSFICMAFIEGETLKARLLRGPVGIDEAVVIAIQVAEGLAQAHEHGIVHRDIKPANLMVARDGRVKIVDFGLAKLADATHITQEGMMVGTVAYMSPEQARGADVDQRTDIWSLGVVLHEMLAGRLPFRADSQHAVLQHILHDAPEPIGESGRVVPPALAEVVACCLDKDPARRFSSAGELRNALRRVHRVVKAAVTTTQTLPVVLTSDWRRVMRIAVPAAVIVVIGALALVPVVRESVWRAIAGTASAEPAHVAVLPLRDLGGIASDRAFRVGLGEMIVSKLARFEQFEHRLWVVPTSEVTRNDVTSASEARRKLGVNYVISGSVLRNADRVRVVLNLESTDPARVIDSEMIEQPLTNAGMLEELAWSKVAGMLSLKVGARESKLLESGRAASVEANDLYLRGRGELESYQGPGDSAAAAELFKRAIALEPNFALAYAGLGEAYLGLYRVRKDASLVELAAKSCRSAIDLDGTLAAGHIALGFVDNETGRYEDAVAEFERARQIEPTNAQAFTGLAQAYERLRKASEAEATYRQAIAVKPGYWRLHSQLGAFFLGQRRLPEAEREFLAARDLAPSNSFVYSNLFAVYFQQERLEEARANLERSIAIKPNFAAYSNLGYLAFQQNDLKGAAEAFDHALKLDDRRYALWGNLGTAYYWGGAPDKARRPYARAVELAEGQLRVNPRDREVLVDLAGYYGMLGKRADGLAILARVAAEAVSEPEVEAAIGQSFEDCGARDRALEWIGRALAHGYPSAGLAKSPAMQELRRDPRFTELLEKSKPTKG